MTPKTSTRKYYKAISSHHTTGDIWMDLPTFGILKPELSSALVITPACDLANAKVETITYLPIVPISLWFTSRSFYYETRNTIIGMVQEKIGSIDDILLKNKMPTAEDIDTLIEILKERPATKKNEKDLLQRIESGLTHLKLISTPETYSCDLTSLELFFGTTSFQKITKRLITNGYSNDLHFLPKDHDPTDWSAIKSHSLVLFRYPITIPIEILDLANDTSCVEWAPAISKLSKNYSIATAFIAKRPLKTLSMTSNFLSDLLTRFVSLYIRVGSPDFTQETISQISNEL